MMKSSEKDGAKDVNEPMKSRLTAVTAVAPAIKHGALAALKYTWGACSRACSTQAHTAVHVHTVLQLGGLNRGQEEGEQPLKGAGTERREALGLKSRASCNSYPLQATFGPRTQHSLILYVLKRPWFTCYLINVLSPCPSAHSPKVQAMPGTGRDGVGALAVKEQSGETLSNPTDGAARPGFPLCL